MVDDLPREEVVESVDWAVKELLRAAGIEKPPVDAVRLAQEHLGIQVCLDRLQPQRGRAQRAGGRRQIYLRPEPTEERHQWTVAHEIGEHFKSKILCRLGAEPGHTQPMAGESLANLFAYRLLVPTRWYAIDAPEADYDLLDLKRLYRTASHEVLAWRFLDLPTPCVITIVDNDQIYRRRSNAWHIRRRLEPVEQRCQREVNEQDRPRRLQENGWTVQGWPVHQNAWKREILRSVLSEW
jgi:Zn-dependent peptidase ImmA (M78 family)